MDSGRHPFLNGLTKPPVNCETELEAVKEWLSRQPHLPMVSDSFVYLFLHSNYYEVKETQDTIEAYFSIRTSSPDLFAFRNVHSSKSKQVLDITHMVALPHKTEDGYNILVYRFSDTDYTKFNFCDAVRLFCMFNDMRLSEDGLSNGYIVIFDMKGCSLGHLTRVSLPALRAFMMYIQDAHPCRLKRICVVHTAYFINQVMCLVKPFIKSNLLSLLSFTTDPPTAVVDMDLLPSDYGGPLPSMEQLHAEQRQLMEKVYKEWFIETETFKCEEKKRIKKPSRGLFASLTGSLRALEVD